MLNVDDVQADWHRLWLQVGDPGFVVEPADMRAELAGIWSSIEAARHLDVDAESRGAILASIADRLTQLALRALDTSSAASFDNGHWLRPVRNAVVPPVERPLLLEPADSKHMARALIREVCQRVASGTTGEPVLAMAGLGRVPLQVERSRPGWLLSGVAQIASTADRDNVIAAFAIDEGDNEVIALVRQDRLGVSVADQRVAFADVELAEADVVTRVHERALLQDRIVVAELAEVLWAAPDLSDLEVALGQAAIDQAAAALEGMHVMHRSRAVSAAVLEISRTCPERASQLAVDWHQVRLAALL